MGRYLGVNPNSPQAFIIFLYLFAEFAFRLREFIKVELVMAEFLLVHCLLWL